MLVRPEFLPLDVHAAFNLASVLTPPTALGALEHDYTPDHFEFTSVLRLAPNPGGGILGGLAAPLQGRLLWIVNTSDEVDDVIVLLREDVGSTPANRFVWARSLNLTSIDLDAVALLQDDAAQTIAHRVRDGADWGLTAAEIVSGAFRTDRRRVHIIPAQGMCALWYDLASARWRLIE